VKDFGFEVVLVWQGKSSWKFVG